MEPADNRTSPPAGPVTPESGWLSPPNAIEILPPDASRTHYKQWQAARLDGIGGSDIAVVLGLVGYESELGLWLTKTGRRPPISDTPLMERGRYLEPAMAQWFSDKMGLPLRKTGTWARLMPDPSTGQLVPGWMRVNPDRIGADGSVIEIKVPHPEDWGNNWKHGPAVHAYAQCLWAVGILDAPHGWVVADGMDGLRYWRVERNDQLFAGMVRKAGLWFHDYVVDDVQPDVDDSEATARACKEASPPPGKLRTSVDMPGGAKLARERHQIKDQIKDLTGRLDLIENLFRAALIEAETAYDEGRKVLSWPYTKPGKKAPYRYLKEPK